MYFTQPFLGGFSRSGTKVWDEKADCSNQSSFMKASHRFTADTEARDRKCISDKAEMKHAKCFLPWTIGNINNGGQLICCTDLAVQKSLGTCSHYSLFRFQKQSRTDRYCLNIVTKPTKGKLGVFLCDQQPTQD